jgi:hypothetical protein
VKQKSKIPKAPKKVEKIPQETFSDCGDVKKSSS